MAKCKEMACAEVMKLKIPVPESQVIKTDGSYVSGLYVAMPKKRDNVERPAVQVDLSKKVQKKTIREIQEENGGAGVFDIPLQEHYILPEEWKYDIVP